MRTLATLFTLCLSLSSAIAAEGPAKTKTFKNGTTRIVDGKHITYVRTVPAEATALNKLLGIKHHTEVIHQGRNSDGTLTKPWRDIYLDSPELRMHHAQIRIRHTPLRSEPELKFKDGSKPVGGSLSIGQTRFDVPEPELSHLSP